MGRVEPGGVRDRDDGPAARLELGREQRGARTRCAARDEGVMRGTIGLGGGRSKVEHDLAAGRGEAAEPSVASVTSTVR